MKALTAELNKALELIDSDQVVLINADSIIVERVKTNCVDLSEADKFYHYGHVFSLVHAYGRAFSCFHMAMLKGPSGELIATMQTLVRGILNDPDYAKALSKKAIVKGIQLLPHLEAIKFIDDILANKGELGKTIWTPRLFTSCKLGHGTLKELQEYKRRLEKPLSFS